MFKLGSRSKANLVGVHPDLRKVVELAIGLTAVDFVVTEGLRTAERQAQLLASGASRTLKSRHLTGHAVDLAAIFEGKVSWRSNLYYELSHVMKNAASSLSIPLEWGGEIWMPGFFDGPHFQLPWDKYPI